MVLIFEIHKDFVHERLCKFTPEIEANRALSSRDQNRSAIIRAGQFVLINLQSVARILIDVQCP